MASGNGAVCGKTLLQHCRVDDDRAAIDGGITRDLYAALGEELETVPGLFVFTTNRLFAGSGRRADDGAGRAAVPV